MPKIDPRIGKAVKEAKAARSERGNPSAPPTPLWDRIGQMQLIERALDEGRTLLPSFNHSIQVSVAGGPDADIRRIWYLCVATTFGRFRDRVVTGGTPISLDSTWDISGKAVSCEINYWANQIGAWTGGAAVPSFFGGTFMLGGPIVAAVAAGTRSGGLADPAGFGFARIIRGPEQLTVGAGWTTTFSPSIARVVGSIRSLFTRLGLSQVLLIPSWTARITPSGCIGPIGDGAFARIVGGILGTVRFDPVTPVNDSVNILREWPDDPVAPAAGGALGSPLLRVGKYSFRVTFPKYDGGTGGAGATVPTQTHPGRLPDEGRVITTGEKRDPRVQNPKPPTDGHTRCSAVISLVAQALQNPCFLPSTPPCTNNPAGAAGVYITLDGASSTDPVDLANLWKIKTKTTVPLALPLPLGADGYPTYPDPKVSLGN